MYIASWLAGWLTDLLTSWLTGNKTRHQCWRHRCTCVLNSTSRDDKAIRHNQTDIKDRMCCFDTLQVDVRYHGWRLRIQHLSTRLYIPYFLNESSLFRKIHPVSLMNCASVLCSWIILEILFKTFFDPTVWRWWWVWEEGGVCCFTITSRCLWLLFNYTM